MNEQESVSFTDMSLCPPASALSREQKEGHWFLVDYETEDGLKGVTMYASPEVETPAVTLPLNLKGWYSIYVGVNYTRTELSSGWAELPAAFLRVKLTDDKSYTNIRPEALFKGAPGIYENKMGRLNETWDSIYEVFWKSSYVTGQDITLSPPIKGSPGSNSIANVAWIRAVPLSEEEIEQAKGDLPVPDTKRLAGCHCLAMSGSTSGTPMYHPTDEEYVKDLIEPFRDSDFKLLLWECIRGDVCTYRTKIARFGFVGEEWNPDWIDPLRVAVDYAHDCDLDIYISMRMVGSGRPLRRSPLQQSKYYYENQRYAILDEDGIPTSNLSLAFPEIRNHWISLLREALGYGADGVHLCFNRNVPFVLYEKPVVDSFKEEYGIDPLTLPFDDIRWLKHRASFVNQYFREIRQMLDEEGRRMGKSLGMAVTFYFKPSPEYNAMDPVTWVEEGLVDYLMPHVLSLSDLAASSYVGRLKEITEGSSTKLYPDIFPRTPSGEAYAEKLKEYYDAGADGFSFWSVEMRTTRASEWAVIKRLGHYRELDRYKAIAETFWRRVPLRTLAGISIHFSHSDG